MISPQDKFYKDIRDYVCKLCGLCQKGAANKAANKIFQILFCFDNGNIYIYLGV